MARVTIEIEGKDKGAIEVLKRTAELTDDVAAAMTKMIVQERNNKVLEEARQKFSQLTETEKKYALAAYDAAEATEQQGAQQHSFANSFVEMKAKLDLAREAVQIFAGTFKQAMDLGKEGAGLLYAQQKFDRLAASIGVTSDALKFQLRDATKGMVADSALVGQAGDLMALGLAKTQDEVVRLTTVAGGLGMDMNQLVLTLANQTTMRFDQLGVSVDGFDAKVQKLKDSGMDANAAFKEAFLQQAEEQLAKIGNKADSSAAAFARLEAATQNASDALKIKLAPALTDAANATVILLTGSDQLSSALQKHSNEVGANSDSWDAYVTEMKRAFDVTGLMVKETRDGLKVYEANGRGLVDVTGKYDLLTRAEYDNAQASKLAAETVAADAAAKTASEPMIGNYTNAQIAAGYAAQALAAGLEEARAKTEANQQAMKDYKEATDKLTKAQQNYNDAQANFTQKYGDKVTQKLEQAGVKGDKLEDALGMLDREWGTNYLATKKANDGLDVAIKKFADTGNLNDFALALEGNKTKWELLDGNLQKAQSDLDLANQKFNKFMTDMENANGKEFVVRIRTEGGGGGNPDNTGAGGAAGQNGKYCFIYSTPVNTPSGYRSIGEIQPGDLVWTFTAGGELQSSLVTRNASHYRDDLVRVETSDGQIFTCSPDHPWAVRSGTEHKFIEAGNLKPMDTLISCSGLLVYVVEVTPEPGMFKVFDLSVMHDEHTFLVGGLVVHNKEAAASGFHRTIPAGYPNDSYYLPLAVSSGERVDVWRPGENPQSTGGGDVYVTVNANVSSAVDVELLTNKVVTKINQARRG